MRGVRKLVAALPLGFELDILLREACKSHIHEMSSSVKEEWLLPRPSTFHLARSSFML